MNTPTQSSNKLTILVEPQVYKKLHDKIGRGKISKFINESIKPLLFDEDELKLGYQGLASESNQDEIQEWMRGGVVINTENLW